MSGTLSFFSSSSLNISYFLLPNFIFSFASLHHILALVHSPFQDTRYVVIQFIEFGGDHLDQLMNSTLSATDSIREIVSRSRNMLQACHKIVYFINGLNLLALRETSGHLNNAVVGDASPLPHTLPMSDWPAWEKLAERLQFLRSIVPSDTSFMFHISRPPPELPAHIVMSALHAMARKFELDSTSPILQQAFVDISSLYPDLSFNFPSSGASSLSTTTYSPSTSSHSNASMLMTSTSTNPMPLTSHQVLVVFLRAFLLSLSKRAGWAWEASTLQIYAGDHLCRDGNLHPQAIVTTLSRMFRGGLMMSTDPLLLAARQLLDCYRDVHLRLGEDDFLSVWLTREEFAEHLDHDHSPHGECCGSNGAGEEGGQPSALAAQMGGGELPAISVLRLFPKLVDLLCSAGLAIRRWGLNHARMRVRFRVVRNAHALKCDDIGHAKGNGGGFQAVPCKAECGSEEVFWFSEEENRSDLAVRLPLYEPLLVVLEKYIHYNIPAELWLDPRRGCDAVCHADVWQAREQLLKDLITRFSALRDSTIGDSSTMLQQAHLWLWMLEDLVFCSFSDQVREGNAPLCVHTDEHTWLTFAEVLCLTMEDSTPRIEDQFNMMEEDQKDREVVAHVCVELNLI